MNARLVLIASVSILLVACASGAAAPTPSGTPRPPAAPSAADPTPPAEEPIGSNPGGVPGDPGDPGDGQARIVFPKPGTLNPRVVGVTKLEPQVEGRQVIVKVSWWSGIEPCNVLDQIAGGRTGAQDRPVDPVSIRCVSIEEA